MGAVFAMSPCAGCQRVVTFNPTKVPSVRMKDGKPDPNGSREPLCRSCAETLHAFQVQKGMNPPPISPDAYRPCDENDLDFGGD